MCTHRKPNPTAETLKTIVMVPVVLVVWGISNLLMPN